MATYWLISKVLKNNFNSNLKGFYLLSFADSNGFVTFHLVNIEGHVI